MWRKCMEIRDAIGLSDHEPGLNILYEKAVEVSKNLNPLLPFVEIGTRRGGSALLLLIAIKESGCRRPLLTVDPYGKMEYEQNDKIRIKEYGEGYYREAMKVLADYCVETEMIHSHFRMTSDEFMKIYPQITLYYEGQILPKEEFGLVYLDGDHHIDIVTREVEYFYPKIVRGGLLSIDDIEFSLQNATGLFREILDKGEKVGNRLFYYKGD